MKTAENSFLHIWLGFSAVFRSARILESFTSNRCRWVFSLEGPMLYHSYPRAGNFHSYRLLEIVSFPCISFIAYCIYNIRYIRNSPSPHRKIHLHRLLVFVTHSLICKNCLCKLFSILAYPL